MVTTPDHYLEKIFQLPVWLDELTPENARRMAAALVGLPASSGTTTSQRLSVEPGSETVASSPADSPGSAAVPPPAVTAGNVDLATSPPESISLDEAEMRAIPALAPLLTRSPRALKRYVNTYYLLKTLVAADDLEVARVLLAIAIGRPELGERLFDAITVAEATHLLGALVDDLSPVDKDWIALTTEAGWSKRDCGSARPVVKQVRQFVFRSERRPQLRTAPHDAPHPAPMWPEEPRRT